MTAGAVSHELRVACRGLARAKSVTIPAVLVLAMVLAGTTVMFSLVQGVVLRPLPVRQPDRLIVAWRQIEASGADHAPFGTPDLDIIGKNNRVFESVAGVGYNGAGPLVVVENGATSTITATPVSGEFFSVLGVGPVLGRALAPGDNVKGAENVLVLGHGLWQRRYGGSREVIGRRVTVNQRQFVIVGVMPPDLDYPRGSEAWITTSALTSTITNPSFRVDVDLLLRMRPGITVAQATSELHGLIKQIEPNLPKNFPGGGTAAARRLADVIVGDVRAPMTVLLAAVGLLVLIACANVSNLLLMREESRRAETAVRGALGASQWRLLMPRLIESLVVVSIAAGVALVIAWSSLPVIVRLIPNGLPRTDSIRIDGSVALFTVLISFVTAALTGIGPALSAARANLASLLNSGTRWGSTAQRGRSVLVVIQVALAVTLVAAAGLLTRSLVRLQQVDMGIAAERLILISLDLPQPKFSDRTRHLQFLDRAGQELRSSEGIAGVTAVAVEPFAGTRGWDLPQFAAEGQGADRAARNPALNLESVLPGYFETFGIALVRGRSFAPADREGSPAVAIVSEDVAARVWPGQDPIGKRLKFGMIDSKDPWLTVVGVARPTRYRELREPRPTLYLPAEQFIVAAQTLVVRTAMPIDQVGAIVRERLRTIDPDVHVMGTEPFSELLARPLARPRFNTLLIGLFGVAALVLTTVGLYGVVAMSVRQRYREIGIRMALGGMPSNVSRFVLRQGLTLAVIGLVIGLAVCAAGMRVLQGMLFESRPLEPSVMLATVFLLVVTTALASAIPAWRAIRMNPIAALRVA